MKIVYKFSRPSEHFENRRKKWKAIFHKNALFYDKPLKLESTIWSKRHFEVNFVPQNTKFSEVLKFIQKAVS